MYDYLIVTHIPAFYKINLYNELAKRLKIFVIFISSDTSQKRSNNFSSVNDALFYYEVLYQGDFQKRKIFKNILAIKTILSRVKFKKILVSGWDLPEFWYIAFTSKKSKNCLALESTIFESSYKGLKGFIKKLFLSRISTVFSSGSLHCDLLKALNFQGEVKVTNGVGIINKPEFIKTQKKFSGRFLYIGRIVDIKNLKFLVEIFNAMPNFTLAIIGVGEQQEFLQSISNKNIIFRGAIENKFIGAEFAKNDVFILPSLIEPWGLVVEEALYFGLPVLISDRCGSSELIKNGINGFIFDPTDKNSLMQIIRNFDDEMLQNLCSNADSYDINAKDTQQISAYL